MESTLFIVIKLPTLDQVKQLAWMLSDDGPIFEDEVFRPWRKMFRALEELSPPVELVEFNNGYLLLNWLSGDWEETLQENSSLLSKAGFPQQAAYYWCDDDEGYLVIDAKKSRNAQPLTNDDSDLLADSLPVSWEKSDKKIVSKLLSLLL